MHTHIVGKITKPLAVAIGNFDGVHIGHQLILKELNNVAKSNDLQSSVLSFYPHPRQVLTKQNFKYIYPLKQKIQNLLTYVEIIILVNFTIKLAQLSALEFVQELAKLNIKYIIIGQDFKFGNNRSANALDLKNLAKNFNIQVNIISLSTIEQKKYASSDIRKLIQCSKFEELKNHLGRAYTYKSKVIKGKQLGRTIGFPTINLSIKNTNLSNGVYAVFVHGLSNKPLLGAGSLGYRPSVDNFNDKLLLEVYIFDYANDVYGKEVEVEFLQKIRPEIKFDSIDELIKAITNDVEYIKNYYTLS